jgi:hypothetical protein
MLTAEVPQNQKRKPDTPFCRSVPLPASSLRVSPGAPFSLICVKSHPIIRSEKRLPARVPPGTYYLMISAEYNKQHLAWSFKVDLKPGPNTPTLDQHDATPVN